MDGERSDLARDGYLILRGAVDDRELASIREEIDAQIAAGELPPDEVRINNLTSRVLRNGSIGAARVHPAILERMARWIGPDVVPYGASLVFKAGARAAAVPMHRDLRVGRFSPGHAWLAASVYLDPARPANGCLWALPGSHRAGGFHLRRLLERGFQAEGLVPLELDPGDVLVHNARVLHGSDVSASGGLRRVLYFSYQSARWILREGLTGSVRPDRAWVAQNLRQAELGVEARAEAGLAVPRWGCPPEWRAEVAAARPDAVAAEVPYRWGAAAGAGR
jgi:hypothetical protein